MVKLILASLHAIVMASALSYSWNELISYIFKLPIHINMIQAYAIYLVYNLVNSNFDTYYADTKLYSSDEYVLGKLMYATVVFIMLIIFNWIIKW